MRSAVVAALAAVAALTGGAEAGVYRSGAGVPTEWQHVRRCTETDHVTVVLALRQRNLGEVHDMLMRVSDPRHADYGKHLTLEQVGELTRDEAALRTVREWLRPHTRDVNETVNGEFVVARMPAPSADAAFGAEFRAYRHRGSGHLVFRSQSYELPDAVDAAVAYASRVVDFTRRKRPIMRAARVEGAGQPGDVYPAVLQRVYGTPTTASQPASGAPPAAAVFEALGQSFSPSDLSSFQSDYGVASDPAAKIVGPNSAIACYLDPNNCVENALDIEYLSAVAQGLPIWDWSIDANAEDPFLSWVVAMSNATGDAAPLVTSISYGGDESEEPAGSALSFDTEVQKLGLRGLSVLVASGDDGVAGSDARSSPSACGFAPSFPASSPSVTAVGATMGPEANQPEVACTSSNGGGITSGGGFSNLWSRPSWQDGAVQAFFQASGSALPPSGDFNATGRGYPDVAFLGHNYEIMVGGQVGVGSGTSASTPVFAGFVAYVNNQRIAAGKSPLGFLNPALYQNADIFRPTANGTNNCCAGDPGHIVCCPYGFTAVADTWSPITGLGSVNFGAFVKVFSQL